MKKILLLLTSEYPYGTGESFLDNEIPYLAKAFDEIHILSRSNDKDQQRALPSNVRVSAITGIPVGIKSAIMSSILVLSPVFLHEMKSLKTAKLKPCNTIYKVALKSLLNANAIYRFIKKYIKNQLTGNTLFLYSYWTDDAALAIMLYKRKNPETMAFSRIHGWDLYSERHPASYLPYRLPVFKGLDAVFVNSNHGINYLKRKFGDNGCHNLILGRLGIKNHFIRLNIQSDKTLRIASCSSVIQLKRIPLLIDALLIASNKVRIIWDHLGSGTLFEETKSYADKVFLHQTNIKHNFHGYISNAQIFEFYHTQAVDLFINVSEAEGLPVSMMEAMCFGIPVIGTIVGGVNEIINDGYNGFLLDVNASPNEVAGKIIQFDGMSPAKKEEFRKNAFHTWEDEFNADKNYPQFIKALLALSINRS